MRRAAKNSQALLGRVLFIGLSVQMILGLLWMACNFTAFQEFEGSLFLEKVSRTLVCDDYTGILYPILIGAARGIVSVIPVPYYCLLYLLQLGLGFYAAWFFLGTWRAPKKNRRFLRIWASLVLLTVPLGLQCHLAVLPCSLAASLLLLQLGIFFRGLQKRREDGSREFSARTQALLGGLWAAEVFLLPEYRWFGLIPVMGYAVWGMVSPEGEDLKKKLGILLVAVAFLGAVPTAADMTMRTGAWGRMENTFEAALFRRVCGGYYMQYYKLWPGELQELLTPEEISECMKHQTAVSRIMAKRVESVYDREKVKDYYLEAIRNVWSYQGKNIFKNTVTDLAGYGFAPTLGRVSVRRAYYTSLAGNNYDVMRRKAPRIAYYAAAYGNCCFAVGLLLAALCRIGGRVVSGKKKRGGVFVFLFCAGLGFWICLWYSMQGYGMMDPKNSVAVTLLWFAWICGAAIKSLEQEE